MDNHTIAQQLNHHAHNLESREANIYRPRAYRRAAITVRALDREVVHILNEEGRAGLEALPGIGSRLALTIEDLVRTGEWRPRESTRERKSAERLYIRSRTAIGMLQGSLPGLAAAITSTNLPSEGPEPA